MTYRPSDSSCKSYSQPQSRLNQQIKSAPKDEGCLVLEESGSVCGETESLNVFLDFKKIYDDCLKKLEQTADGRTTLRKLAPFQRLIDHLWEQNSMLIETVRDLEEEATCRLSTFQDKLNKSCQKINDYQQDIKGLIKIIHRFCEKKILDTEGVEFRTLCPSDVYGPCGHSFNECEGVDHTYQPETPSRSISISSLSSHNFEVCGTSGRLKSINCITPNCVKNGKQIETKFAEKDSGSIKSVCSENAPVVQSESSCCCSNSGNTCNCCMKQNKENKGVTWVPE